MPCQLVGVKKCMPYSAKFSLRLHNDILSTDISDFLKQSIFLKSFNSVLHLFNTYQFGWATVASRIRA